MYVMIAICVVMRQTFRSLDSLCRSLKSCTIFLRQTKEHTDCTTLDRDGLSPGGTPTSVSRFCSTRRFIVSRRSRRRSVRKVSRFSVSRSPTDTAPSRCTDRFISTLRIKTPLSSRSLMTDRSRPCQHELTQMTPPYGVDLADLLQGDVKGS